MRTPLLAIAGDELSRVRCASCGAAWWMLGKRVIGTGFALELMRARETTVVAPVVVPPVTSRTVPGELLTTRQVAEIFSVCQRTISNWVKAGKLPAIYTAGAQFRFKPADVEELLRANR